ncbi:carbonic anhydrase 2 [Drosophila sulfurigaster albostrigata]|uniref:carbonic anhydrase 2 n=1 Tax=Drosophila sulfurigaster albostrigata TaxID=89887 RepID=UPI002D218EA2|nr:carbonic anhydrase 2 [Drosophila sulfurigaster albostrigata]
MYANLFHKLFFLLPLVYHPTKHGIDTSSGSANSGWNFDEHGLNWEGTCMTGRRQSPIRLSIDSSLIMPLPRIFFGNYDERLNRPLTLVNKGYTVDMAIPETRIGQKPFITGGLLKGKYVAEGVHFHWGTPTTRGAEHIINKRRFDIEMHIVHRNADYHNISEALNYPDGIAVLGIMLKIVRTPDRIYPGLRKVFAELRNVIEYHAEGELPGTITLGQLLGDLNTRNFYTYRGSLTTPDCNEAVTWTVFPQPIPIPYSEAAKLWQVLDVNGNPLENNYRAQQRRNNRPVFYRTINLSNYYLRK